MARPAQGQLAELEELRDRLERPSEGGWRGLAAIPEPFRSLSPEEIDALGDAMAADLQGRLPRVEQARAELEEIAKRLRNVDKH